MARIEQLARGAAHAALKFPDGVVSFPENFLSQHGQFSTEQIRKDSDYFFIKSKELVTQAKDRGNEILSHVGIKLGTEHPELQAICEQLTSPDEEIRLEAVRSLRESPDGQVLREKIIEQTQRNMAHILYEHPEEKTGRRTYTHEETVGHMPEVLANIYAASCATLGFLPNDEQLHATIALVDGHNILREQEKFDLRDIVRKYDKLNVWGLDKKEPKGTILDVKTGEGKSAFIAGAAAIIQALHNSGVHVATENNYLAREGAESAAKLAKACGMTVGLMQEATPGGEEETQFIFHPSIDTPVEIANRSGVYLADITYGPKSEFEFDALHDNLATAPQLLRQIRIGEDGNPHPDWSRKKAYAIIDEADAVLLDQATTPTSIEVATPQQEYTIHGQTYTETELRILAAHVAGALTKNTSKDWRENPNGDYVVEKGNAILTQGNGKIPQDQRDRFIGGSQKVEALLRTITVPGEKGPKPPILHENEAYYEDRPDAAAKIFEKFLYYALQAEAVEEEGKTYRVIRDTVEEQGVTRNIASVVLLSSHTRRDEPKSRYQHGLSSALEAKQKRIEDESGSGYEVTVFPETTVLASSTTFGYWSMYKGLSGMTGSANEQLPKDAPTQLRKTPAQEYSEYYSGQRIITIPEHKPTQRIDHEEFIVYATIEQKLNAIANFVGNFFGAQNKEDDPQLEKIFGAIDRSNQQGRPFLIGLSRKSDIDRLVEIISKQQWFIAYNDAHPEHGITVESLTAEDTQEEGDIIARAGQVKNGPVITIASIAGRGTDIRPDEEALKRGGLYVISGEAMRGRDKIQHRGRAGRQGQPGEWRQFISVEDPEIVESLGEQWVEETKRRMKVQEGYKPYAMEKIRPYLLEAEAKRTNGDIDAREGLHRDYESIIMQMDLLYAQRREVLFSKPEEHPEMVAKMVSGMARSYVRHLLVGTQEVSAFSAPSEESDTSIPNVIMHEEEAFAFVDRVVDVFSLPEIMREELDNLATTQSKKELLESVTQILESAFNDLPDRVAATLQPLFADNSDDVALLSSYIPQLEGETLTPRHIFSTPPLAWRAILTNFDQKMGPYITDLVDLREEVMRRGDKMPADVFRLEAYSLYHNFKPQLQEAMLQAIYSEDTYVTPAQNNFNLLLKLLPPKEEKTLQHPPPFSPQSQTPVHILISYNPVDPIPRDENK